MTYQSRIGARPARLRSCLMKEGVASIDLNQRMMIARGRICRGSIAGDWHAVGKDVKRALGSVKRELETA